MLSLLPFRAHGHYVVVCRIGSEGCMLIVIIGLR